MGGCVLVGVCILWVISSIVSVPVTAAAAAGGD